MIRPSRTLNEAESSVGLVHILAKPRTFGEP
ncbi:hypothetical protein XAP6984_1050001 [Xanthomonas phaseoli pv. phaseoli]|uniref:Transposase n=1 Tax=Xanthomonas campestris pv. phaseoli TaxID=317013 RepID=A0ABY1TLC4_XANCH|nr:hypothetical protein XAP6984_1050001 [Xanthomonas phaseoli pv. phaseoli]